jgi:threonine synthase
MDISKASNFERFVFDLLDRDGARTRELFGAGLARDGAFTLSADEKARLAGFGFVSGRSTHADRLATIRDTDARFGVVIDTHTADGLKVAREHVRAGETMLVLETALPIKFAETIEEALGRKPAMPEALADLESRPKRFTVVKADVGVVKAFIETHAPAH